jgi:hypothetical protein
MEKLLEDKTSLLPSTQDGQFQSYYRVETEFQYGFNLVTAAATKSGAFLYI